jgi:hypothetical protein
MKSGWVLPWFSSICVARASVPTMLLPAILMWGSPSLSKLHFSSAGRGDHGIATGAYNNEH